MDFEKCNITLFILNNNVIWVSTATYSWDTFKSSFFNINIMSMYLLELSICCVPR